ncbi:hypothetical protein AMTR_s00116p00095200 [Amborella trichopoda]|uniref:Uncharacterized protein n=1 Tax=Amborella trichopoda TaxID=13333 RepID=W1NSF8_AMBTC|nr:hypothetical protein AMTR_s00116p00095200 [Amborella trichopoda]
MERGIEILGRKRTPRWNYKSWNSLPSPNRVRSSLHCPRNFELYSLLALVPVPITSHVPVPDNYGSTTHSRKKKSCIRMTPPDEALSLSFPPLHQNYIHVLRPSPLLSTIPTPSPAPSLSLPSHPAASPLPIQWPCSSIPPLFAEKRVATLSP